VRFADGWGVEDAGLCGCPFLGIGFFVHFLIFRGAGGVRCGCGGDWGVADDGRGGGAARHGDSRLCRCRILGIGFFVHFLIFCARLLDS
jgi:hypothetical protein